MKTLEKQQQSATSSIDLVDELQTKIAIQAEEITSLNKQLDWFKQQFKLSQGRQFGKSSETSQTLNLSLFDEKLQGDERQVDDQNKKEKITYTRKKKSVGRKLDISKFPKQQIIHDLKEHEKKCRCGNSLEKMSEDTSMQVEHIKESIKVLEHVTYHYCCRDCDTIKSAKKPETAIPKCMATAGFIAEVITKKYEQHLPLYRQSKIFARLGADIPDNTLGNWVMGGADALSLLGDAYRSQFKLVHLLQADETKVKTLKPNRQGYLWAYHSFTDINRFIFFEYAPSRGATYPNQMLQNFTGILQTDGFSGYNDLRAKPNVINVGCWDHCRRKFVDVVKVADQNRQGKAAQILLLINQLYDIERDTKLMMANERQSLRLQKAKPLLDEIKHEIDLVHAPPKSLLGVAITYANNQWPYLTEYIHHGEMPISNCWIENQIRPFALGRRNWLFTGNPESANKAALLYSLIQTCHLHDIQARAYLEYVLNQAQAMRRGDIDPTSLLPQHIDKSLFIAN